MKRIYQIEVMFALVLIMIGFITIIPFDGITGFVSVDTAVQDVNITLVESHKYTLSSDSIEPFHINSFKLSGTVLRKGVVQIFIDNNDGQRLLIYQNKREGIKDARNKITGFAIQDQESADNELTTGALGTLVIADGQAIDETAVLEDDEVLLQSDTFDSACVDSCFMDMEVSRDLTYDLIFLLERGAALHVNKIIYDLSE